MKNNSGATILMALLLILLATAVGAAVLTAAVSAARHLRSDREAQQNYLTVSSAAELIRDSINGQTYQRTLTEIHTFKEKEDGGVEENISRSVQMTPSDGKLKGVIGRGSPTALPTKVTQPKTLPAFKTVKIPSR